MKKIPTIYLRDPETNLRHLTRERHPACGWVFAGEGTPTRKYDGLCLMLDEQGCWFRRRTVKPTQSPPEDFTEVALDPLTGIAVGWVPLVDDGSDRLAWETIDSSLGLAPGTYELCGPKVNGNPEAMTVHHLIRHADVERLPGVPKAGDFDALAEWLHAHLYEGIVWHHTDGRMAKIKRKDFPA